jgi:hypothetical protein
MQIEQAMQEQGLSRTAMATRMHTSRAALNRLLDPANSSVTLRTLHVHGLRCVGKGQSCESTSPTTN